MWTQFTMEPKLVYQNGRRNMIARSQWEGGDLGEKSCWLRDRLSVRGNLNDDW